MKITDKIKSAVSVIMGGMIIISSFPIFSAKDTYAAELCVVNTEKTYQTIKGFGGMNLPDWIGDLTDEQRKTAFQNGQNDLGLSIVRVYVSDDRNQWNRAVATAKYAQSQGAIVFATPWNPPSSMTEKFTRTYKTWDGKTQTQENQKRLRHDKYAEYASHLNDFYHYMKDNGVELYAISIQNEPDYGEDWTWMTEDECVDFLANYADKIDCPVMSPESFSYNKSYYNAILNNSKANANVDIWGTHFYGTSRQNMDFPVLENDSREVFMTEVYVPNSSSDADTYPEAIEVAENIHNALVVGNMNAYVWWYIRRSYGPMKENGTLSKRGYCMAQYSKFVRPGSVRVDATEQPANDVYISAYKKDSQVTVVAVNKSKEGYAQQFSVNENIKDIDRLRTSANENLALTENLEYTDNSFWAQLPAESVSTFIITTDGSSQPVTEPVTEIPVDSDGYYFHDTFEESVCDWTGHGSSDVLMSGRTPYKDKNALLVQNREKSWNGAEKQLDSSFKSGEEYSFSVCAEYFEGSDSQNFKLSLQYTDPDGNVKYANIAQADAVKGKYVQLANTNFTLPKGNNYIIYVETSEGNQNFYIDEAVMAKAGTVIEPPQEVTEEVSFIAGDINSDGKIDSFDMVLARKALAGTPFESQSASYASDVNNDGQFTVADVLLINNYILGKIKKF